MRSLLPLAAASRSSAAEGRIQATDLGTDVLRLVLGTDPALPKVELCYLRGMHADGGLMVGATFLHAGVQTSLRVGSQPRRSLVTLPAAAVA